MSPDYIWRTRQRGELVTPALGSYQEIYCNGTYKYNLTGLSSRYSTGTEERCTDTVHPNFSRRKLAGKIMNTPIHLERTVMSGSNNSSYDIFYSNPSLKCTGTNFLKQLSGQGHLRSMQLTPGGGIPYEWFRELESNRLDVVVGTRAWGGIQSPHIQGTVFAAEIGKTFSMLMNPLSSVKKFLHRLKKSKRYRRWAADKRRAHLTVALADFISEEWLRYRYGIMPLLYDIQGIMKIFNDPVVSPRLTSRASDKFSSGELKNVIPYSEGASGYFQGSTTTTLSCVTSVSAGVLYEHEARNETLYGYGLDQQLSAIWELLPRSFIVDWFVNLGDFIDAYSPKIGVKVLAQWTTIRVTDSRSAVAYAYGVPPNQYYTVVGNLAASAFSTHIVYKRQPLAERGLVNLTKSWDFGRVKEQFRSLDAIALIIGLLGSR